MCFFLFFSSYYLSTFHVIAIKITGGPLPYTLCVTNVADRKKSASIFETFNTNMEEIHTESVCV